MIIQPPACLVAGAPGAGKTDVLPTYIEAGVETFVLSTEPGGVESLLDSCKRRGIPIDKLHWATVMPASGNWSAMEDMIKTIGQMDYESITKIKSGVGKDQTRQAAMNFLNAIKNFKCERTGQEYGDVTTWKDDRAFCIDSLSGLSMISWHLTLGYKPAAHQGEWGIAMNWIDQMLLKISSDRSCHLAVTAHVEKEIDEMSGAKKLMVSTLGAKLAPKVPKFFSEFIRARRLVQGEGFSFQWSTLDNEMELKNRALPIGAKLVPNFKPVVEAYRARLKAAQESVGGSAPAKPALTAV